MSPYRRTPIVLATVFCIGLFALITYLSIGRTFALFETAGSIATKERDLLIKTTLLISTIIVPVFFMTFFFAWKYRAENTTATYTPEWAHGKYDELIWWAIPAEIILLLSVITWKSTHDLDPYKPLPETHARPVRIQAIALDWKWLFIYPDEHVATVNMLKIPIGTPIDMSITADAPMNSLWIPELAGQIYAMPGMTTKLHFDALREGIFRGRAANFSGPGFSDMTFTVEAKDFYGYKEWVASARTQANTLNKESYTALIAPSKFKEPMTYGTVEGDIFNIAINRYMVSPKKINSRGEAGNGMPQMN